MHRELQSMHGLCLGYQSSLLDEYLRFKGIPRSYGI